MAKLRAPFPYFGGKATVAPLIWSRLGDVSSYVEPFCGSCAVLLARPPWEGQRTETVNDADGYIANFWRAVQQAPGAVADHADWPVNEVDLEARHRWLVRQPEKAEFLDRMKHDAEYYDAKRAGWWCWGLAAWIGRGWCKGEYFPSEPGQSHGCGVRDGANKLPRLGRALGIHRQLPNLGDALGIHRQLPNLGDAGTGECTRRLQVIRDWIGALADRLRNVLVTCGDWARVVTAGATAHGRAVGVFLDPPYAHAAGRDTSIYNMESATVADDVHAWCVERGADARYRIVLAGYEGEHDELEALGWSVHAWKTQGGYANNGKTKGGKVNRGRERLWASPSCVSDALFA